MGGKGRFKRSEGPFHRRVAKPDPWRVFLSHTSELRQHPGPGQSYVDRAERAVIASGHTPVDMIDFASLDHRNGAPTCVAPPPWRQARL